MGSFGEHIRRSGGYKWWLLLIVMLGTFMAVLDVTVVNVGLPTIMSIFGVDISSAEWIVTSYMITMTVMLPSAGWFADRFGNKRIYLLGLVLFTVGSWLCGRAGTLSLLVGARALQGLGSGVIQSLGLALVIREFPPREQGVALGFWSVAAAASISFGPLLGGFLVDDYGWHRIFDVNVPVGIATLLLALLIQKEWRSGERTPFDWRGFGAVLLFMPLTVYALARGNSPSNPAGWGAGEVIGSFAVGAVALAFFVFVELHTEAPLLQLRLFIHRNFAVAMGTLALFAVAMVGGNYLLPLYMQRGLGYTAMEAGAVFLPVGIIQGVLAATSGLLTRYLRPLPLVFGGIGLMGLSLFLSTRFTLATTHFQILLALSLRGLGMGLTFAPLNLFSLVGLSARDMAAASGIGNSIKQLFGVLGIALLTVLLTSRGTVFVRETYMKEITDAFSLVMWFVIASLVPLAGYLLCRGRISPEANNSHDA